MCIRDRAITSTKADVVEWRVDWYEDIFDFAKTEETMKALREVDVYKRQILRSELSLLLLRISLQYEESHLFLTGEESHRLLWMEHRKQIPAAC